MSHPSHYSHGRIEVAVAMDVLAGPEQWLGHSLKYACRAPHKGNEVEDLRKSIWCVRHAADLGCQSFPAVSNVTKVAVAEALAVGIVGNGDVRFLTRELVQAIVIGGDLRWHASRLEEVLETAKAGAS